MEINAYFDNQREVCLGCYRIGGPGRAGVLSSEGGANDGLSIVGKAMAGAKVAAGAETAPIIGR